MLSGQLPTFSIEQHRVANAQSIFPEYTPATPPGAFFKNTDTLARSPLVHGVCKAAGALATTFWR